MVYEASLALLTCLNHNKLCPPTLRSTIQRPRLLRQLSALSRCKLVLLCAEAGYGKTTLILDFLTRWANPTIWYRLDKTDRDVTQFTSYLVEGIAQRVPDFGIEVRRRLMEDSDEGIASELPRLLLHEISKLGPRPLLLVLDNFETVASSDPVASLVSHLLEYSGSQIHFAIASRTMPPLPIARLVALRDAVVIGPEELSLTTEESHELLLGLQSVHPTDSQLDLLWRRTEGWAAGIIMVAEALQRGPTDQVITSLEELRGPPDMVYHYFANEVFREQSAELQRFLLETSILKRLSRDVVNDLLGIREGGDLLATLRRGGVFAHAVEAGGGGDLRYHPLFRAFLLQKLYDRYGEEHARQLYRVAAHSVCRHEQWSDAIDFFAAASEWEQVANLLEQIGEEIGRQGLLDTVRRWLDLVPEDLLLGRPRLLLLRGWLLRRSGRHQESLHHLAVALRGFLQQEDRAAGVRTELEMAMAHHRMGEFRKAEAVLTDALHRAGDDVELRSLVLAELAENAIDLGDLEHSVRWAELAIIGGSSTGVGASGNLSVARALRFQCRARVLQGELQRGLQDVGRSLDICRRAGLGDYETSWSLFTLGQGLVLQGDFEQAFRILDEAEGLAQGDHRPLHRIWTWRGIAHRDVGAFGQAEHDLRQAGRDYRITGHSAQREMAFLNLRRGYLAEGLRLAEESHRAAPAQESQAERAARQAVYGIALAAVRDRPRGLAELADAAEAFRRQGRRQQLASIQWHRARFLLEEGRAGDALEEVEPAILWASARGVYQLWWWDPQAVARLLPSALGAGLAPTYLLELARLRLRPEDYRFLYPALETVDPSLRPQLLDTLREISGGVADHDAATDLLLGCQDPGARRCIGDALACDLLAPVDLVRLRGEMGLTWKEIEILVLYYLRHEDDDPDGHFRKRLAESLALSEETVKVHIRSIRRKLQLPDRRRGAHVAPSWMMPRPRGPE